MRLAWLVIAACGGDPALPDAVPIDAMVDAGPPPGFPATITVTATHGTLASGFAATIAGSGVAIAGSVGTMAIGDVAGSAALYNQLPFSSYDIFGSVVTSPTAWSIAYPYCMDGMLVDVYAEPVGPGGFTLWPASGTCAATTTTAPTLVDLPGFTIATPPAFGSASVHGAQIDLAQGYGEIAIDGARKPAVVFDTVDCSTTCGTPGWYELHTLIWDADTGAATFVIVYLKLGMTDRVQLSYALRLPALDDPFHDVVLAASWTGTAAAKARVHLPPPWQR